MASLIENETDGAAKAAKSRLPSFRCKSESRFFRRFDSWTPVFTGVTKKRSSERLADQAFAWCERSPFPDEVSYKLIDDKDPRILGVE
jgi:hypothetical protein